MESGCLPSSPSAPAPQCIPTNQPTNQPDIDDDDGGGDDDDGGGVVVVVVVMVVVVVESLCLPPMHINQPIRQ